MTDALDAPITAVTVYPGQARVTRKGVVRLESGERRVLVGGLPLQLRPDSVRVSGRGAATVLGVDVRAEHHARTPDSTIAELQERRDAYRAALDEFDDKAAVLSTQAEMIGSLTKRVGSTFAPALARNDTDPSRVADVNGALARQLGDILSTQRDLAKVRRRTQEDHDEVEREINNRTSFYAPDRMAVDVDLEVAESGEVEIELSYLVHGGSWDSRYDVRLAEGALVVTWYGLISQHTGEDWPECDLALSTAQPTDGVTVPELDPWYVDVFRPMPKSPGRAYGAADMAGGAPAPAPAMAMAASAPQFAESFAVVEQGVTAATYRPARRIAVPSDGTSHRTTVAVVELSAKTDHVTVPLRGPEAYLRATVTNTSELTLRPGEAAIFHDNEFVGSTHLDAWAPGEEVELTLGVDERIRVERELVRRSTSKAVLGGTRKQEAAYRIKVGNYGPRTAHVTVIDQIPVSRSEQVVVKDVTVKPEPSERTDLGEVTWTADIAQGATATFELGFRLDIAKGAELSGWRD